MKLDALEHPKTMDFAARLGVELVTAIGHLELFWSYTGKHAAQGNIGKWPDGTIAMACHWRGKPEVFVQALVDARLLDRDPVHRLLVHDWDQHAQSWVRMKLKKARLEFVTATPTATAIAMPTAMDSIDRTPEAIAMPTAMGMTEASTRARVPSEGKGREGKGSEAKGSALAHETGQDPDTEWESHREWVLTDLRPIYPTNVYTDADWEIAARPIAGSLVAGEITREQLLQLTTDFAAQQDAKGNRDTQYVENPVRHFDGRGKWRGPFPLPAKQGKPQREKHRYRTADEIEAEERARAAS